MIVTRGLGKGGPLVTGGLGYGDLVSQPPAPPPPPGTEELFGGGAAARGGWESIRDRRRRDIEIEEAELLALGEAAIEQIMRDYINKLRH